MQCPNINCSQEMVDHGNMMECPKCHVFVFHGSQPRRLLAEPDYGAYF